MIIFSSALFSLIATILAGDICKLPCNQHGPNNFVEKFCSRNGYDFSLNCCYKDENHNGTVVGIDLSNCSLTGIDVDLFKERAEGLEIIDLTVNQLTEVHIPNDSWSGLINLREIYLPASLSDCPNGDNFWEERHNFGNVYFSCSNQRAACNITNTSCPEHSTCLDYGPGRVKCQCMPGRYGYKCLKAGIFPYVMYFSILGASTVVTAVIVWTIERRLLVDHSKTN